MIKLGKQYLNLMIRNSINLIRVVQNIKVATETFMF